MDKKTLGQIAYEAWLRRDLTSDPEKQWELIAEAVAEEVKRQDA